MKNLFYSLLFLTFIPIDSIAQNFEWAKNYSYGPQNKATSIGTDKYGNVYIKGEAFNITGGGGSYFYSLLYKLDNIGNVLWVDTLNIGGKAVTDTNGYTFIVDGIIAKYNSAGQQLWTVTSTLPTATFKNIALHPLGGIIVVGKVLISDTIKSILSRYDENGNCLWTKVGGFLAGTLYFPLACDQLGNSYIAGESLVDSVTNNFGFLVKYDMNGNLLYNRSIPHSPNDIVIDNQNNIIVTGWFSIFPININGTIYSANSNSNPQPQYLIKYDQQGNMLWHKIITGQIGRDAIATDTKCNIYLTINYSDIEIDNIQMSAANGGILIMKVDSAGNISWIETNTFIAQGEYGSPIFPGDIYINSKDEVFVTGTMAGTQSFGPFTLTQIAAYNDLFVVKIVNSSITTAIQNSTEKTGTFNIFPNPGSNVLNISSVL